VTLVSVVVWLFAESQSLQTATQLVTLRFESETGDRLVNVASEGWTGAVRVQLEGPASVVQEAPGDLTEGLTIALGAPGVPDAAGEQTVDLRNVLRNHPALQQSGLRVEDVEPPTVRLEIRQISTLSEVPIAAALEGVETAGPVRVEPLTASVRAPQEVLDRLRRLPGGARVEAALPAGAERNLPEGQEITREALLRLPSPLTGAAQVRIQPSRGQITFTVRSKTSTTVVSAPVWVSLPPFEQDRWVVEVAQRDQLLQDLTATGPSGSIERIVNREAPVIATVALTSDELEAQITEKTVRFIGLPSGVTISGAEAPVSLTIRPRGRSDASGSGSPGS
jgi:hypothetical protein